MRNQIINYLKASYPGLYLVSCEEERVEAELKVIAGLLRFDLYTWSITTGLMNLKDGNTREAPGPMEALALVPELPNNCLVVLQDFHQFLNEPDPALTRCLKDLLRLAKTKGKTLLMLGCRLVLPPELERQFVVVSCALPGKEELGIVLDNVAKSAAKPAPEGELRDLLLDSATGLTCWEAENAFALSVVESGTLSPQIVTREKANEVKKNGLLEVCSKVGSLDDIGGLDLLKAWLVQRKDAFSQDARQYGLPSPKGLLIVGIPGTGKSLTAKATASVFNRPLLRLDAGRLFAGLVGQSEANLRSVIATVEAIAPCVLWIDAIEKGFSGLFFIDLPNEEERLAIWKIQIAKYHRQPEQFELVQLARATEGWTGSEIEQVFIDALYDAFSRREEPTDLSLMLTLNQAVPLSKLMGEQITGLRQWAKQRARLATRPIEATGGRRMMASN
jgi:hypothetical protein